MAETIGYDEMVRMLRGAAEKVTAEATGGAGERYNALSAESRRVAGAFHLTC